MLNGKTVIVGISGGIAAYKTVELVSQLKKLGACVWVAMTDSAQKFVSPLVFRALSGNPIITTLFDDEMLKLPVPHISLAQKANLMVVAPATANIIGKIAQGIADDALSTIIMSCSCPKLIAPAMNTDMWENPIVHENCAKLQGLGYLFCGPEEGALACGDSGIGRMSEPEKILEKIAGLIAQKQDLKGKKILITAGGTQEAIDPVRFIGNRSSGKMGYAIAKAAVDRGANVTLISGTTSQNPLANIKLIKATSSSEMYEAVMNNRSNSDVIIMAAAVADYQPKTTFPQKLKKDHDELALELKRTKDILSELGQNKNGTYLVGFSLESENLMENAKEKLQKKNLDMIVANDPSTFDNDYAEISIIDKSNRIEHFCKSKKLDLAHKILDRIFHQGTVAQC